MFVYVICLRQTWWFNVKLFTTLIGFSEYMILFPLVENVFWLCTLCTCNYCTVIFNTLARLTGTLIEPNAITALFSIPQLPRLSPDLTAFVTLLARRLILRRWKTPAPPSHALWIKEIFNNSQLDKIRYRMKGCGEPFFAYAEKTAFPE